MISSIRHSYEMDDIKFCESVCGEILGFANWERGLLHVTKEPEDGVAPKLHKPVSALQEN